MEKYFENIKQIGDLELEHIFYEYEEPVLFVCINEAKTRFLCSCCKLFEKWIIAQTTEDKIIEMIANEITLADVFSYSSGIKMTLLWDGENLNESLEKKRAYLYHQLKLLLTGKNKRRITHFQTTVHCGLRRNK